MVAIFVIATILTAILIEYFRTRGKSAFAEVRGRQSDRFLLPRGYFFNPGHSWTEILFSGKARIGVDDFVQKIIGSIGSIDVAPVGKEIRKGETLFTIIQGGKKLAFASPISGIVHEVNTSLLKAPSLMKNDPYIDGWIAIVEPHNIASELKMMKVADEAAEWLRSEMHRFRDFITVSIGEQQGTFSPVGVTMHDGGIPMQGALERGDHKTWKSFEQSFLKPE
jgi:glycine cleavage system H lipoate-binding protein